MFSCIMAQQSRTKPREHFSLIPRNLVKHSAKGRSLFVIIKRSYKSKVKWFFLCSSNDVRMTQFSTSTWMQHTFVNLCEKCLKTAHAQTEAHHLTIKPQTFVHQWSLLQVLITEGFQICCCNASSNVCRSEHIFVNTHNYPQITHLCDTFEADFSPYASRSTTIKGDSWGFLGYHSPSALYPPWSYSTGIPSMCLCIYLSRQTASSWDWADDGHCSYMYRNWWVSDLIHRNKLSCTV